MLPLVTVYTPTWNRARTLPRLHEALEAQTFREFEWIVSDDASTDGTIDLLQDWQNQASFTIRIRAFPQRAGKPAADNDAVRVARGRYFIQIGSDDEPLPHCLSTLVRTWDSIPKSERDQYGVVTGLSVAFDGTAIGRPFPSSPFDVLQYDLSSKLGLNFDGCMITRTDLLRRHPFPEVDYVVPESVVFLHALGRSYMTRCVNDVLLRVTRGGPDVISGYGKMRYNRGYAYGTAQKLNDGETGIRRRPLELLRTCLNYGRLSHHGHVTFFDAKRLLRDPLPRALHAALYPAALLVAARDRRLGKVEYTPFVPFKGTPRALEPRGLERT